METHLETCAGCRKRLEQYRGLSSASGTIGEDAVAGARDRVWRRLAAPPPEHPAEGGGFFREKGRIWNRSVTLPLPAAAAVFVVIALFVVLALKPQGGVGRNPDAPPVAAAIDMDVHGIAPVSDMKGVLQYLSNQESPDFVIIRLPESRSFSSYGEPALLKAADYSGGSSPGRVPPR